MRTPAITRRPRGIPEGGEFAGRVLQSSGISLLHTADPWAAQETTDLAHVINEITVILDADPAKISSFINFMHPSTLTKIEDNDPEISQGLDAWRRMNAAGFGGVDEYVVHAGSMIAARGQEISGITPEEIKLWHQDNMAAAHERLTIVDGQRQELLAEQREFFARRRLKEEEIIAQGGDPHEVFDIFQQEFTALHDRLTAVAEEHKLAVDTLHGCQAQTRDNLARLADGYHAALAETRDMGGDLIVHQRSAQKAVTVFQEAANLFPSDWIQASNAAAATSDGAPYVRFSTRRGHYQHRKFQQRKKREPVKYSSISGWAHQDYEAFGRSRDPSKEIMHVKDNVYEVTSYDARFGHSQPRGSGWEKWTSPEHPNETRWRRPRTRMATVEAEYTPEITLNALSPILPGRPKGFDVAAHELSHRFEYTVPHITYLEGAYLDRRALAHSNDTDPELVEIYPGQSEFAYDGGFTRLYTGKYYGLDESRRSAYEILSTGMDAIFGGRSGGLAGVENYAPDADHRNFVLGTLATVGRKNREG